jgi:hypothetical protein
MLLECHLACIAQDVPCRVIFGDTAMQFVLVLQDPVPYLYCFLCCVLW